VYDYYPSACSLEQCHLLPSSDPSTPPSTFPAPLSEELLWSYTVQLVSAIHAVHSAQLALYDTLTVRRVLVVAPHRIRVNGVGMRDLLMNPSDLSTGHRPLRSYQQEDLYHLGHLLLTLAAIAGPSASYPPHLPLEVDPALEHGLPSNLRPLFRLCASRYSTDLAHLIA